MMKRALRRLVYATAGQRGLQLVRTLRSIVVPTPDTAEFYGASVTTLPAGPPQTIHHPIPYSGAHADVLSACATGDIAALSTAVGSGVDLKEIETACLTAAAKGGSLEVLGYLAEHGLDLRADEDAALAAALEGDRPAVVTFLQQKGVDVVRPENFIKACEAGSHDVVVHLHMSGIDLADVGADALAAAAAGDHVATMQYLHRAGVGLQSSAMEAACASGAMRAIKFLSHEGIDVLADERALTLP